MTGKISDFGSLGDRVGATRAQAYQPVHAWLDDQTPVIVADWRKGERGWEALTIRAVVSGAASEWVSESRVRPAR